MLVRYLFQSGKLKNMKPSTLFILFSLFLSCQSIKNGKSLKTANQIIFHDSGVTTQIPFERRLGQIVFNAAFVNDGKTYSEDFFLDTGGINAINNEIRDSLELKSQYDTEITDSGSKNRRVDISTVGEINLNDLELTKVGVVNANFTDFEIFSCIAVGSLGPSILQNHVWHFNMDNQKISISNESHFLDSLLSQTHFSIPIRLDRQLRPIMEILINGNSYEVMFDTGANGFFAHPYNLFSEAAIDTSGGTMVKMNNKTQHGASVSYDKSLAYLIPEIKTGDLILKNTYTTVKDSDLFLIGNKLMDYFHVTLNYPEKKMYLHPVANKTIPQDYWSHGLGFDFINYSLIVSGMTNNGPAMKAGLLDGDRILKINGKAPEYDDYCDFLLEDINLPDTVVFTIQRGNQEIFKQVIKEKLL